MAAADGPPAGLGSEGPATAPTAPAIPPGTAEATNPTPLLAPLAPLEPPAEVQQHGDGRLAAILCQGQPLRLARCRYGQVSGLVTTYHASGSVAEVFQFREGLLDGLIEVYDPTGHLLERTLYREGAAQPSTAVVAESTRTSEPTLPAPPAVSSGEASGPPMNPPAGVLVADPVSRSPATAPMPVLFGLGVRGLIGMLANDVGGVAYSGAQIVLLPQFGGLLPELAVGVASTIDPSGQQRRFDVPISLGYVWNLSRSVAPLYLLASFDILYARRSIPGNVPGPSVEEAWLLGGSGGLGINMPVWRGQRTAGRMLLDLRLGGTSRVDGGLSLLIPRDKAEPAVAIGNQFRLLLTMTMLLNFGS